MVKEPTLGLMKEKM